MKVRKVVYVDGLIAGIIGAAIIAIWFLFLDTVSSLPLSAPTILGTALFVGPEGLSSTEQIQVSMKLTLLYTWVHGLVFIFLGEIAAYFVLSAEKNLNLGLSIIILFVILEVGFVGTTYVLAKPVLTELAWPMVLLGNFLAATAIASYLWIRHPFVLKPRPEPI